MNRSPRAAWIVVLFALACREQLPPRSRPAPLPPPPPPLAAPIASAPQRERPPAPAPVVRVDFPAAASKVLQNGLTLEVLTRRTLPVVDVTLLVETGDAADAEHPGVARVTSQLLESGGAGALSSRALRERIDDLGSSLEVLVTRNSSRWSLATTSDRSGDALSLLATLVRSPRFDPTEFRALRAREVERVQSLARTDGTWLAHYVLNRTLYRQPLGVHPYASIDVLASELTRLDLASCRQWHRTHVIPKNARLIAVGDIDLETLERLALPHFGSWRGNAPVAVGVGEPSSLDGLTIEVVDRPRSTQSEVLVGVLGPVRGTTDYPEAALLQQIIGGGVAGRLFLDVRERRSLAYSTHANTRDLARGPSVLFFSVGTQTAKTADAVDALLEHLDRAAKEPVTELELQAAQRAIVDGMPAQWETVEGLSGQWLALRNLGLSDAHYDEFRDAVGRATPESVQHVGALHYRRDRAAVVVAGDAELIAKDLTRFGAVQILDPEKDFAIRKRLPAR